MLLAARDVWRESDEERHAVFAGYISSKIDDYPDAILRNQKRSFSCAVPEGGGYSGEDDRRIFLGLKFYIPGFFWVGKFGKYIFGWLNLGRDFLRIQNNLKLSSCIIYVIDETEDHVFGVSSVVRQKAREIGMGFFFLEMGGGGLNFGPGIFVGFVGNHRDFFAF